MNIKTLSTVIAATAMLVACGGKDVSYDATGVFEATEVVVSARAQGEITSLMIEEGDTVRAGAVVGSIDTRQLSLYKEQLTSSRAATDSRLLTTERQVASLREELSNARREHQRYSELLRAEAATQKQVDDMSYQIKVLEKRLAAAIEQQEASNKSTVNQSQSIDRQMGTVDVQLSDAQITSPISGTILTKYAEQGEYAVPGKALFRVADISRMTLRVYVVAPQLTSLKIGQKVTVYADKGSEDRTAVEGTITWIAQKAEFTPKTIQTRDERANLVYAVKVGLKNDGTIKAGMYGDVKFAKE